MKLQRYKPTEMKEWGQKFYKNQDCNICYRLNLDKNCDKEEPTEECIKKIREEAKNIYILDYLKN